MGTTDASCGAVNNVLAVCILGFSAVGIGQATVKSSLGNNGPHGLSEVLYTYTSGVGNNGSAFAGINANTMYLNTTIGFAMLCGRFLMLIPLLAAAGSLAQKKLVPVSAGTFPTHGPIFVVLSSLGVTACAPRQSRAPSCVPVQREQERARSPLMSIPPLRGGDFQGIRVYRSDVFLG